MKRFFFFANLVDWSRGDLLIDGVCSGDESINLGDYLNDLEVVGISVFGREVESCAPGYRARVTFSARFRRAFGISNGDVAMEFSESRPDRRHLDASLPGSSALGSAAFVSSIDELCEIIATEWNPLGIDDAKAAYARYSRDAVEVAQLLNDVCARERIVISLFEAEGRYVNGHRQILRCRKVADSILKWTREHVPA